MISGDVKPMTVSHSTESLAASAILTVNTHEQVNSLIHEFKSAYVADTTLQKMILKKQVDYWKEMWYCKGKLYVPAVCIPKVLSALHDELYSGMHLV